ncbi:hypothetical protein AGMMS49975_25130 [Clostridia bacterium]|nr:hypothetical protein AGMMS49975_25130 [Clostridia bacterium]
MKYIVQRYTRFPIYEPAEGGYYYDGSEADDWYEIFDTIEEANNHLKKLVEEHNSQYEDSDGEREGVSSIILHPQVRGRGIYKS